MKKFFFLTSPLHFVHDTCTMHLSVSAFHVQEETLLVQNMEAKKSSRRKKRSITLYPFIQKQIKRTKLAVKRPTTHIRALRVFCALLALFWV